LKGVEMAERGAIVITWGEERPGVPGAKGMEVFGEALGFYDNLAKQGRITGYRVYGSTTRQAGMLVIEGEVDELAKISTESESLKQLALGCAVVQDLRTELYIGGSADDVTQYYVTGLEAVTEKGLGT
jgi:hypothetical protein